MGCYNEAVKTIYMDELEKLLRDRLPTLRANQATEIAKRAASQQHQKLAAQQTENAQKLREQSELTQKTALINQFEQIFDVQGRFQKIAGFVGKSGSMEVQHPSAAMPVRILTLPYQERRGRKMLSSVTDVMIPSSSAMSGAGVIKYREQESTLLPLIDELYVHIGVHLPTPEASSSQFEVELHNKYWAISHPHKNPNRVIYREFDQPIGKSTFGPEFVENRFDRFSDSEAFINDLNQKFVKMYDSYLEATKQI